MNESLELSDPEHPEAYQAALATARLLIAIHEQRLRQAGEGQGASAGETDAHVVPGTAPPQAPVACPRTAARRKNL